MTRLSEAVEWLAFLIVVGIVILGLCAVDPGPYR